MKSIELENPHDEDAITEKGISPAFTTNLTNLLKKVRHLCRTRNTIQASKLCQKKKKKSLSCESE
jgi:hypothetical protein